MTVAFRRLCGHPVIRTCRLIQSRQSQLIESDQREHFVGKVYYIVLFKSFFPVDGGHAV